MHSFRNQNIRSLSQTSGYMVQLRLFGLVSFKFSRPALSIKGSNIKIVQCVLKISNCLCLSMYIVSILHWLAFNLLFLFGDSTWTYLWPDHPLYICY